MRQLSKEEQKAVKALVSYPEWQDFLVLIEELKMELRNVEEIDTQQYDAVKIAADAIGRKFMINKLNEFLKMIEITAQEKKPVDKTYE